jgi:hypothetical protein
MPDAGIVADFIQNVLLDCPIGDFVRKFVSTQKWQPDYTNVAEPAHCCTDLCTSGSYQKKPRTLGYIQFDHDIVVLSIQTVISLH